MIMSKEKLCTLIIRDIASAKNITEGLILNIFGKWRLNVHSIRIAVAIK